jgi:hypothetical protein
MLVSDNTCLHTHKHLLSATWILPLSMLSYSSASILAALFVCMSVVDMTSFSLLSAYQTHKHISKVYPRIWKLQTWQPSE